MGLFNSPNLKTKPAFKTPLSNVPPPYDLEPPKTYDPPALTSILSITFEAQPKPTAYLLLYAPVPTPQVVLDSFVLWGSADNAAVFQKKID